MDRPGASRRRLALALNAAFAEGLISEETFAHRLDYVLRGRVIEPSKLVGDLHLRNSVGLRARVGAAMTTVVEHLAGIFDDGSLRPSTLLALDWTGNQCELMVGRHRECEVVLQNLSVSRRHARLIFRDGHWVLQDLASTNGTTVNGRRVGRCELRPGDWVTLGDERLRID